MLIFWSVGQSLLLYKLIKSIHQGIETGNLTIITTSVVTLNGPSGWSEVRSTTIAICSRVSLGPIFPNRFRHLVFPNERNPRFFRIVCQHPLDLLRCIEIIKVQSRGLAFRARLLLFTAPRAPRRLGKQLPLHVR